ncbi:hypothetical protein U1Q18_024595 [Sarracenia purpurea var. burkii]
MQQNHFTEELKKSHFQRRRRREPNGLRRVSKGSSGSAPAVGRLNLREAPASLVGRFQRRRRSKPPEYSSSVRSKNGSAESADYGSPRLPVERYVAEPRGGLHISDAGTAAAPPAYSGRRLAPTHLPLLVHQETEANHRCSSL